MDEVGALLNSFENSFFNYLSLLQLTNLFLSLPFACAPWYSDRICQICFGAESAAGNAIIICDGCEVSVHQFCYAVGELPGGTWLCKACELGLARPICYLCGNDSYGNETWCFFTRGR